MKKYKSIISIWAALSLITAIPFSASAESGNYTGSMQLSKYAFSAEEAASGNASVTAKAYIRGYVGNNLTNDLTIKGAQVGLSADSQIYMRNLIDPNKTYTESSYNCLGIDFITAYKPFCFGNVSDNVYSVNTAICSTRDLCLDPIAGNLIKYSGNDTITIRLPGRYYIDENGNRPDDKVTHEIVCPLTINSDGSATYTFTYADIYKDHYEVKDATGVISYYQPEALNEGDYIPDLNNRYSWAPNPLLEASFLGNSDDFPIIQTDAFLKKGTPCGIYSIGIDENFCDISASLNGESTHFSMKYQPAAIAVGVEKADMSAGDEMPVYACYFAEDTKIITGASVNFNYVCDITYSDGTSESKKNVTGAVNAGISPSEIIKNSSKNYFIGDIPMYCGDTPLTYGEDENNIKVLIGKKGDVNLDGTVDIADTTAILEYYAEKMAGLEAKLPVENTGFNSTLSFFLADIDTESQLMESGGNLDISDATAVLTYYANNMAGNTISWDQFLK